jgi:hypothetical protein
MILRLPFRRALASVLLAAVVGLLAASAIPHQHDGSALSHAATACRLCKLHESGGAAVAPSAPIQIPLARAIEAAKPAPQAPRALLLDPAHASRSPPQVS